MGLKGAVRIGDPTSHGGQVVSAGSNIPVGGKELALVGDTCSCPIHGAGTILEGSSSDICVGKAIAYDGCTTSCGAKVISTTDTWLLEPNRRGSAGTSRKLRTTAAKSGKRGHPPQKFSPPHARRRHPVTSAMLLSDAGRDFISRNEGGDRATVYRDSQGLPTAGVGHLLNEEEIKRFPVGSEVPQGIRDAWFDRDLSWAVRAVQQSVGVELTQPQFDALVDFTFNIGPGAMSRSRLLRSINNGQLDRETMQQGFNGWLRGGPGIPTRRAREADLFSDGAYLGPSRR